MATKTHYLIFSSQSGFDWEAALALLSNVEARLELGGVMTPTRLETINGETRVYFGLKYVSVTFAPLAEAVAVLHQTIQLDEYTEADQYVYKPAHALRICVEADDEDVESRWRTTELTEQEWDYILDPATPEAEYNRLEPKTVVNADGAICHMLIDRFPPAVFVMMAGVDLDGIRFCFPSEPRVWDWD